MVPQFPHLSFGFGIRMASLCGGGTKSLAVVMRSGSGRGGPGESVSASVLTQHSIYTEELNPALNLAGIMVEDGVGGWGGEAGVCTDSRTIAVETGRRRQCPANRQPRALRSGIFMNSCIFWLTKVLILWV